MEGVVKGTVTAEVEISSLVEDECVLLPPVERSVAPLVEEGTAPGGD